MSKDDYIVDLDPDDHENQLVKQMRAIKKQAEEAKGRLVEELDLFIKKVEEIGDTCHQVNTCDTCEFARPFWVRDEVGSNVSDTRITCSLFTTGDGKFLVIGKNSTGCPTHQPRPENP